MTYFSNRKFRCILWCVEFSSTWTIVSTYGFSSIMEKQICEPTELTGLMNKVSYFWHNNRMCTFCLIIVIFGPQFVYQKIMTAYGFLCATRTVHTLMWFVRTAYYIRYKPKCSQAIIMSGVSFQTVLKFDNDAPNQNVNIWTMRAYISVCISRSDIMFCPMHISVCISIYIQRQDREANTKNKKRE